MTQVSKQTPNPGKRDRNLSEEEIKALNKLPEPLEELYQGWMDCDAGICSVLEDSVSLTLEDVLEDYKDFFK